MFNNLDQLSEPKTIEEAKIASVRACNSHYALVEALEKSIAHFDTPRMMPPETRAILEEMKAALSLAKGE